MAKLERCGDSDSEPPAPSPFKRGTRLTSQEMDVLATNRTNLDLGKLRHAVAQADSSQQLEAAEAAAAAAEAAAAQAAAFSSALCDFLL